MGFSRWLRHNAEHYLLEAAQIDMARRHRSGAGPLLERRRGSFFWRKVFVPVYRLLPWRTRRAMMRAMPGSHRKSWQRRAPPTQRQGRAPMP